MSEEEYAHLVCHCDDNLSLCGKDVTEHDWDDSHKDCPMCVAVDVANDYICPRCGCEECPIDEIGE